MSGAMDGPNMWAWMWVWVWVWLLVTPTLADWDESCPRYCKCTYASNRKLADCPNADFSTIPTTLSGEVQELNLVSNKIKYLQKDAFQKADLVNLQKLYLRDNDIRSVHMDAFRGLSIMIELDLSHNRIDKLHPMTFTGMEKLRVLDLSNNLLSRLNGVQFPPLHHLRKLIFTSNRIQYIHNYAFVNLPLLTSLRLSENQLKHIQPDLFTNNTGLLELELHDNLWQCDCRLKDIVRWVKLKNLLQTHVTCHSPQSLSGDKWDDVEEHELACRPELSVPQVQIPAAIGQNASLSCHARGEPVPKIKWVLHGRVLTNQSVIRSSETGQRYMVREGQIGKEYLIGGHVSGGEIRSHLTVMDVTEEDFTYYTCVADNFAGLVERNVSLIPAASESAGAITPKTGLDLYIIIAIVVGSVALLIVIIIVICCCVRRHRNKKPKTKVNGVAGGNHMDQKSVIVVNPVNKPPRQYKQVPQTDMELSLLNSDPGAHRSYDDVDYPEPGMTPQRTPLATLDEEDDELPSQDTTLPLDNTPSHSVLAEYMSQYPDLLDMTRPRAISPTQLSYHSVVVPQYTTPVDHRYSYAHPSGFTPYNVAYVPPTPVQTRPGYVTLPRRHRTPSWAGQTSTSVSPPPLLSDEVLPYDPVYDTLGPRTTADGTSRTDLTRPGFRSVEPRTSQGSPSGLPPYYTPIKQGSPSTSRFKSHNHTLPRSTPNLLEGNTGLSLPHHDIPTEPTAKSKLSGTSPSASSASPSYKSVNGTSKNKEPKSDKKHESPQNKGKSEKNIGGTLSKKVPPKPPPKPSSKRLSVSSTSSEVPKKSSVVGDNGRVFQDEGPDGTEV